MTCRVLLGVSLAFLTAVLTPAAHADIYKCKDEHGNVAYLQTPCPVEKLEESPATNDDDAHAAEAAPDEEVMDSPPQRQSSALQTPSSRLPGEPLDECKKRYRDQIDEIDAEMRTRFSPEQGEAYKERLMTLTKQLRACR
jgi:hypothetical protein